MPLYLAGGALFMFLGHEALTTCFCHDPDFSKFKISSCIHGILHFKIFFQSFELYSSENIVKCPFSQVLDTKAFRKKVFYK
jgi:hypothetical protein